MLSLSRALKILSIVCALAVFQNCAPHTSEDGAKSISTGQIQIHPGVRSADQPASMTPTVLEFSLLPTSAGTQGYQFFYRLDVGSGVVTARENGRQILILSEPELTELRSLFDKTMIANSEDFLSDDLQCATVMMKPYARMISAGAVFDLGFGTSTCSVVDLYWLNTSELVPLRAYLEHLEDRLPQ